MAESLRAAHAEGAAPQPDLRWYACYTRARHEKRVEQQLEERGIETFLPLVPRERRWKDRVKRVELPLFPSYVFGRFDVAESHRVLSVPGVANLVRTNGRPAPIDEAELDNVRRFVEILGGGQVEDAEPCPFFAEGEPVEVVDGPCRGLRGEVVEHRGRRRVFVGLKAVGQGMVVSIDPRHLRTAPE